MIEHKDYGHSNMFESWLQHIMQQDNMPYYQREIRRTLRDKALASLIADIDEVYIFRLIQGKEQ